MSSTGDTMAAPAEVRSACSIIRTHQRFLLRSLEFTQQYALMYRSRLEAQVASTLSAIQRLVRQDPRYQSDAHDLAPRRVLELNIGVPTVCVGVLYKNMKLLPRFLDEYQRELVRIDAGDDENDGDGSGAVDDAVPLDGSKDKGSTAAATKLLNSTDAEEDLTNAGQTLAAADEHYSICDNADELLLEDSSGRVLLCGLQVDRFCTGVVLGIYGILLVNGRVEVLRYAFGGDVRSTYLPRAPILAPTPCYIAFVCGLNLNLSRGDSREEHASVARARASLELLAEFLSGNTGNEALRAKSRCISRLVIGGNSIAPTDELKLKKKVKLDPSDHVRLNDEKAQSGIVTSAALMRQFDAFLERVVKTVEVELMPGDNDMSNAFQPQQPLHPVLLPKAARYSTLRLVSNPYSFVAQPFSSFPASASASAPPSTKEELRESSQKKHRPEVENGINFFVTAGQNINDVARETRFPTRLDTMSMVVESGCACPTAPNTLFSYPFRHHDPFLFQRTPHCVVACDQPRHESRYATLDELFNETHHNFVGKAGASSPSANAFQGPSSAPHEEASVDGKDTAAAGVRLVCVPSFARSAVVVLVDVHSPRLETCAVTFSIP